MHCYKRLIRSRIFGRAAHADVFETGPAPEFLLVLFGGSGVDQEEYERRSRSVIPVFGSQLPLLDQLADRYKRHLAMVYVTAPFDVPFSRFATEPAAAQLWKRHIREELLEPWSRLRYFVCSFSGGAALAFNGLHADPLCFGGAALGADALPERFACPAHWGRKLRLYMAPGDGVCNHPVNRQVIDTLVRKDQAERVRLRAGGHRLADYCTAEGLGDVLRIAADIAPCNRV